MSNISVFLRFSILSLMLFSCSNDLSPSEELKQLLSDDSAYTRLVEKKGFKIKVTYLPLRYFELRELQSVELVTDSMKEIIKLESEKNYGNGLYFLVNLSVDNNSKDILNSTTAHFGEWSEQLQKFLFKMKDYIYLETTLEKEIKLSVYDFQRSFGYTKDRSMLLVFPKEFNDNKILSSESDYLNMHFREWGFGIGNSKVTWDISDLH